MNENLRTTLDNKQPNTRVDPEAFRVLFPRAAFLGQFASGKDTTATLFGYPKILKFASPLYELAELMIPGFDKGLPGGRKMLQTLGAFGRGDVSDTYPLSIERGLVCDRVEQFVQAGILDRAWVGFGKSPDFWCQIAVSKLAEMGSGVAVTDARYPNEVERLWNEARVPTFLVTCRPETLEWRRKTLGYAEKDTKDSSEWLANSLTATVREGPTGLELAAELPWFGGVIWSDTPETCPPYAVTVGPGNVLNPGFEKT